ncbi:MAG: carboxymuconolactone decarboxylase family protein [Gammaproteobacteria bacterium]
MPQFKTVTLETAEGEAKEQLESLNRNMGRVPNIYAVMAQSPSTLAAQLALTQELGRGTLSDAINEKIALVVSNDNSCGYCVSAHSAIAASLGMSDVDIIDAQKGKSKDPLEQAILTLAISINGNHGHGDNSAIRRALEAGLTEAEVIEVVGQVVKNIMTNTVNGIAETTIDFPNRTLI